MAGSFLRAFQGEISIMILVGTTPESIEAAKRMLTTYRARVHRISDAEPKSSAPLQCAGSSRKFHARRTELMTALVALFQ